MTFTIGRQKQKKHKTQSSNLVKNAPGGAVGPLHVCRLRLDPGPEQKLMGSLLGGPPHPVTCAV